MQKIWSIVRHLFVAVMTAKAFNGCVEILSSIFLLFYGKEVEREVFVLTNYEITERHTDFVAKTLIEIFNNFSISTLHFISFYLLFHGLMNLFLVGALWKHKIWAYPTAIIFFLIFVVYQYYRFYHNHSTGLLLVTILDSLIIILTMLEYKRLQEVG